MTAERIEAQEHVHDVQRIDEWIVCVLCGEIQSHARALGEWQPQSADDADWVCSLVLDAESEIARLDRKKLAILKNLTALTDEQRRRIDWIHRRFGPALQELARAQLDGKKSKSWRLPHGILRFRSKKARLTVVDDEKALQWAKAHAPAAVHFVERLLISELPKELVDAPPLESGFAVVPASESFAIDTGGDA